MSLSKKEKEIQKVLSGYRSPAAVPERRNTAVYIIEAEYGKKGIQNRCPYWIRLKTQIAYIPKLLWLVQGILLTAGLWAIMYAPRSGALTVLSAGSPVLGVTVFPVLLRSFSNGMWELEQSARFSLKEICGMRLLIFGLTDTCILAVLLAAMVREGTSLSSYLYWVIVPFALSCSCYMYLIRKIRRSASGYMLICAGAVLGCVSLYVQGYKDKIEGFLSGGIGSAAAAVLPAAAAVILGIQVYSYVRFIGQKGKGWEEIWNYS